MKNDLIGRIKNLNFPFWLPKHNVNERNPNHISVAGTERQQVYAVLKSKLVTKTSSLKEIGGVCVDRKAFFKM